MNKEMTTDLQKLEQYHATHEAEFGMYNASFMMQKIGEYTTRHILDKFAACYFNIRRLSSINDEYGRDEGTYLLRRFLAGLERLFRNDSEILCRISGDNFAILFRKEHLDAILSYLSGTVIDWNTQEGSGVKISAWAGVYLLPEDIEFPTDVMDRITFAIKIAKDTQSEDPVFFDEKMMAQFEENKRIQFLFPQAIQKEEFQIYYQPKVLLKEYSLAGAEALCRWKHDGETILPDNFIPVIEQNTRICQLDFYMLEHVCRDIRRWLDEGRKVVRISVNLSRRHFYDKNLLEHILEIVDRYQVPHKYIEIELTETSTEVKFHSLKNLLEGLKKEGIHTAVDDFGSGYSSLNLIRELPWDVLKLDKSFIDSKKRDNDKKAQMMFGHVIAIAREMGMECITEGVETVEQVQLLKENSCFLAQGYFFDRPLPVAEFETRLQWNKTPPAG